MRKCSISSFKLSRKLVPANRREEIIWVNSVFRKKKEQIPFWHGWEYRGNKIWLWISSMILYSILDFRVIINWIHGVNKLIILIFHIMIIWLIASHLFNTFPYFDIISSSLCNVIFICADIIYTTAQMLGLVRFYNVLKELSYVHQKYNKK